MVPLYSGGETPSRFRFRVPLTPFGPALIHCYTLKPAEMRGFLGMEPEMAFRSYPPPAPAAHGGRVCTT